MDADGLKDKQKAELIGATRKVPKRQRSRVRRVAADFLTSRDRDGIEKIGKYESQHDIETH
jgi:hypothetical protein